jgi:uroporphyrinogen decarboxylase
MVPYALGQDVNFIKEQGPVLEEFNKEIFLKNNKKSFTKKLQPVYEAIKKSREKLNNDKSLIGFIGAPWTLLVYMLNIKLKKNELDYDKVKSRKDEVKLILDKLNDYLCIHIENQIDAGADVIQIFDSWAGLIKSDDFSEYCIVPNSKIVDFCRKKKIPVICFPRGIGKRYKDFNNNVKPNGISIDFEIEPNWAKTNLKNVVIQGGLAPKILLGSEDKIIVNAKKYLDVFNNLPYIFNLGHGLLPETDPEKVKRLIKFYREY